LANQSFLHRTLSIAFLTQMLLSLPLWTMSGRSFIAVPLLPVIQQDLVRMASPILFGLLCIALIYGIFQPERKQLGTLAILAALILLDVHRLQVWVWFYILWLLLKPYGAQGFRALATCVYLWSGLNKINQHFLADVIPDWQKTLHLPGEVLQYVLAALAICAELFLAYGIWRSVHQKWVLWLAIALHTFILAVLALQGNWNMVVWPWNIALPICIWYCSRANNEQAAPQQPDIIRDYNWYIPVGLAGIMPAFYSLGIWPYTLSWMLYSGLQPELTFTSKQNFAAQMSPKAAEKVFEVAGESFLVLDDWTFSEARVPPFQHPAVFERHAEHWCSTTLPGQDRGTYRLDLIRFCKNCEDLVQKICPKQEERFPGMGAR
jgi:hypothetical protein